MTTSALNVTEAPPHKHFTCLQRWLAHTHYFGQLEMWNRYAKARLDADLEQVAGLHRLLVVQQAADC